jgi:hypothetical protein
LGAADSYARERGAIFVVESGSNASESANRQTRKELRGGREERSLVLFAVALDFARKDDRGEPRAAPALDVRPYARKRLLSLRRRFGGT